MCSDAANGEYEGFKVSDENGCSREGEATTSESRVHLSDLLEMLIRVTRFRNSPASRRGAGSMAWTKSPYDSIASDYAKVIKNPMCFLRMREKIHAQQYSSWFSFTEDFERICYNAMKYNQKRSQIWNAANLLLRQGKRCLEQQFSRHDSILGLDMQRGYNHQETNAAEHKSQGEEIHVSAQENFVPSIREIEDQFTSNKDSSFEEVDGLAPEVSIGLPAQNLPDDFSIEILKPLPEEDCRPMFDDQATECSSSFSGTQSGTQSDLEDESFDVDSELRDGNGANAPTDNFSTSERKKRPIHADWKLCREGIEWQCRWLELRIQRLQNESNKYTRILEAAETLKDQRQQDASVSRTSDMGLHTHRRCRIFRRRRRRKAEECVDSMRSMSSHPVFSNYEKQMQETSSAEKGVRDESQQMFQFDDFDFDIEDEYEYNIVLAEDSMEQYLWQIEALQMRISNSKNHLDGDPPILEASSKLTSELEAPRSAAGPSGRVHSPSGFGGRPVVRDLKGQGGTPSSRRRNSDFDINNVIMPDPQMVNYVEPARHAFIETPHWRLTTESPAQDGESSDEDTDDEAYNARHAQMQAQERQLQYSPLVLNRSRSLSTTKERPRRRGSVAKATNADELQRNIPTIFGYIPKGKRTKRARRVSANKVT